MFILKIILCFGSDTFWEMKYIPKIYKNPIRRLTVLLLNMYSLELVQHVNGESFSKIAYKFHTISNSEFEPIR